MKKSLLLIVIILTTTTGIAQNFEKLAQYTFKSVDSYKNAEPQVLEVANYLFENPANVAQVKRLNAIQYIINWMQGTPDYTFEISKKATDLTKGNSDLLGLYMAAMTKVVLDNSGESLSNAEIYKNAEDLLVTYCSDDQNKIKPSRKIKKLIKSKH